MPGGFTPPEQISLSMGPPAPEALGIGSNIAAATCNALLYMASNNQRE